MNEPQDLTGELAARVHHVLNAFLQAILTGELILLILENQWQSAATVLVLFSIFLLPSLLRQRFHVIIPAEFRLMVVGFAFASLFMGSVRGFYEMFWWWDIVLHFFSGLLLGIFGFLIIYLMNESERVDVRLRPKFAALFAFAFALAAGTAWEIFEFAMDRVFGLTMQRPTPDDPSGLTDTMRDLSLDAVGAGLISLFGWWYMSRRERSFIDAMIVKFVERNRALRNRIG